MQKLAVTDLSAIKHLVGSLERIDILFNCAGYVHNGKILDCSSENWDFSFNLNVRSIFQTIRAVFPKMLAQQNSSIIKMSSVVSSIKGVPNRFVYGASKAAVIGLTKSVATFSWSSTMRGLETMQKRVALSLSVMLAMACTSVIRPAKASPSA